MKVLITGGLGFIGSHMVQNLLAEPYNAEVIVLDNESSGHNYFTHKNLSYIIGDICDLEIYNDIPSGVDYVIHLAAGISVPESMEMPQKYYDINIEGSRKVFEWAAKNGVKACVGASSAAIYGDPEGVSVITEDIPYGGVSPYAETKFKMEGVGKGVMEKSDTEFHFCRFFNVFGPRQDPKSQYSGVISKFFSFVTDNVDMIIFGDGEQTRDFVYVQDVVRAVLAVLMSHNNPNAKVEPKGHGIFNVATNVRTSITGLANVIKEIAKSEVPIVYKPPRAGDIKHSLASYDKINKALGWNPETNLADGLAKTFAWFQSDIISKK